MLTNVLPHVLFPFAGFNRTTRTQREPGKMLPITFASHKDSRTIDMILVNVHTDQVTSILLCC